MVFFFFFRNNCQHQSSKIVWNLGRKYGRNFRIFIRLTEQTHDSYGVLPNETFSGDRLFVPKVNKSSKKFAEIELSMKSSTFFVLDMLSKRTFRLKIGQKYKNFSELLESQRVVPNAKSLLISYRAQLGLAIRWSSRDLHLPLSRRLFLRYSYGVYLPHIY